MFEALPSHEFDLHVLTQLEKLFKDGGLETLIARSKGPGDLSKFDSAVIVRHLPSGKEAKCDKYTSQIRNKVSCLLTLLLDTPRSS